MPLHDVSGGSIWQSFSPNAQGFSSVTSQSGRYIIIGDTCICTWNISGTSNATTFTFTLPVPFGASANSYIAIRVGDNGIVQTSPGSAQLSGTQVCALGINISGSAGFTASGTKSSIGHMVYELG